MVNKNSKQIQRYFTPKINFLSAEKKTKTNNKAHWFFLKYKNFQVRKKLYQKIIIAHGGVGVTSQMAPRNVS